MKPPSSAQIQSYLASISFDEKSAKAKKKIKIVYFGPLDKYEKDSADRRGNKNHDIKKLGYGSPYLIVYHESSSGGKVTEKKSILSTMRIGFGFGHDYRADRVDNNVLAFDTWNTLPQHCRVWDVGAFNRRDSAPLSLGNYGEFFLLRPMIEGVEYYRDLDRIYETGRLEAPDLERAESLANYLAKIHNVKYRGEGRRELYSRKIRDTVGHGECVFGLIDSYPAINGTYLRYSELEDIEKKCVSHRWKLKERSERLSRVHGDFHPWNVLFDKRQNSTKFTLLDRSRGEWGEPADDVCAMSINYLFYSLRKYGEITGEFRELFEGFMMTYSQRTNYEELSTAMPLFYVYRALVIASPVWYPDLSDGVRRKIFNFAQNLLDAGRFDYLKANDYFRDLVK